MQKPTKSWSNDEVKQLKVPPHSLEAEKSVVGGLMLDNEAWDKVADKLTPNDFYRPEHSAIYTTIAELAAKAKPFDVVTLSDVLERKQQLEDVGGLAYLSEIAKNTPSVANIKAYAEIVKERSVLRKLLAASNEIADEVYSHGSGNYQEVLDAAEQKVFAIAENESKESGAVHIKDVVPEVVDKLDHLMQSDGSITGLQTNFQDLDHMTSGLQPADMVVIAGRPSMGKTLLGMNIAESVAMKEDKPVLVFSLEMPKDAIMMRILSSLGRVEQNALRSGQLDDSDWSSIVSTMSIVSEHMKLYIDDTAALSPAEMRARARRIARDNGGLSLIVVDYLQLMQIPGFKEGRANEVSSISRSLKALAKELNVPIIALSQLSRKSEERNDKRPIMSDLRDSGAIEQDADVIMFIYRDEVYHPDSEQKGTAEIIIGKQRNGPTGMLRLTFLGHYCRFDNYTTTRV